MGTLRCYDYVNQAYARVRDLLLAHPHYVFRHATAAEATQSARLHVKLGPLDIGADVVVCIAGIDPDTVYDVPALRLRLVWEAVAHPGIFPAMTATLRVFPLSSTETQLELEGTYDPPLGPVGKALDAVALHRIAEVSAATFVKEVAGWLREELARPTASVELVERAPAIPAAVDAEC